MLRELFNSNMSFHRLIAMLISYGVVILVAIPVREWAKAFVASKLGDPTPRMYGRLTINPLAHLDIFGTIMMVLFGFGFSKGVPIDSRYFRNPRTGRVLVALTGPVSNLLMAFLAAGVLKAIAFIPGGGVALDMLWWFFFYIARVNISFAAFHLLPLPHLDGYDIISPFLPAKWIYYINRYQQYTTLIILILLATDALNKPLDLLYTLLARLVFGVFGLI